MSNIVRNILIIFLFIFLLSSIIYSQNISHPNLNTSVKLRFNIKDNYLHKTQGAADPAIFIGAIVVLFATPTLVYENKKIYFGLSRELSLAFGKIGEFRVSAEYSYIFRSELKHHFRASMKYDILSKLTRNEWFDERDFFSIGAGYFIDADGGGIFPEVAAGFRIGSDGGIYLYPAIKLRHTFMTKKDKPDNTDFSLGMIIGYQLLRVYEKKNQ